MGTFLFKQVVYGPVQSRRFGTSLGVNLLPAHYKHCNYNCIYCECGWTVSELISETDMPTAEFVSKALENKLLDLRDNNRQLDVITFAGNGEPTLHPAFEDIIDDAIRLRNIYAPNAKITVLTNATMLENQRVFSALNKVDNCILKIDSGTHHTFNLINKPVKPVSIENIVANIKKFSRKVSIQTLFLKGEVDGEIIDNTTEDEIEAWLTIIKDINPYNVMIYPIDRNTPAHSLEKISEATLDKIGNKVKEAGIDVMIVY